MKSLADTETLRLPHEAFARASFTGNRQVNLAREEGKRFDRAVVSLHRLEPADCQNAACRTIAAPTNPKSIKLDPVRNDGEAVRGDTLVLRDALRMHLRERADACGPAMKQARQPALERSLVERVAVLRMNDTACPREECRKAPPVLRMRKVRVDDVGAQGSQQMHEAEEEGGATAPSTRAVAPAAGGEDWKILGNASRLVDRKNDGIDPDAALRASECLHEALAAVGSYLGDDVNDSHQITLCCDALCVPARELVGPGIDGES